MQCLFLILFQFSALMDKSVYSRKLYVSELCIDEVN
jgi:hypothetical protein